MAVGQLDIRHKSSAKLTLEWLTKEVLDREPAFILISYEQGHAVLHGFGEGGVRVIWTQFRGIPICVDASRPWGAE